MKLLIAGLVLLAAAVTLLVFSALDPGALFVGGAACTFLGFIRLISPTRDRDAPDSGSDVSGISSADFGS